MMREGSATRTMGQYFIYSRLAEIKDTVSEGADVEKRELSYYCQECITMQPLWKTVLQVLRKLNIELSCDSAIPLLGVYCIQKKSENMSTLKPVNKF